MYIQNYFYFKKTSGSLRILLLLMGLFLLFSRGYFQFLLENKVLAYWISCLGFILFSSQIIQIKIKKRDFLLLSAWLLSGAISIFITWLNWKDNYDISMIASIFYFFIMSVFICLLLFFSTSDFADNLPINKAMLIFLFIGWLLYGVAVSQQFIVGLGFPGNSGFNGSDPLTRPASLTGSYLHYPLVIFILGSILLQFSFFTTKVRKFIFFPTAFLFMLAPLFAYSRSGVMLLCFFLPFYGALFIRSNFSWRHVRFSSVVGGILITVIIVAVTAGILSFTHSIYIERALSSIDINAPGNSIRIQSWMQGLSLWWHGNIFFGEHTGLITNSVKNILHEKSFVVESSFIQQLCNFGLIGTVIFYAVMLYSGF